MTTWSSPFRERPRRYSNRPCLANRRTNRSNLLVDVPSAGLERGERQTNAQVLRAIRRACAERSQADRMAIEAGDDFSVRVRFERDMTAEPGGKSWRRSPSPSLYFGSAQAGMTLRYGGELD